MITKRYADFSVQLPPHLEGLGGKLTDKMRNLSQVTMAVVSGDLSRKITVDARGKICESVMPWARGGR